MKKIILFIAILGLNFAAKAQTEHVDGQTKLVNPTGRTLIIEKDDDDSWLTFHDPGQHWYSMGIDKSNSGSFSLNSGGSLNSSQFVMSSNGNIGIGTTTPNQRLSIQGNNTSVSVSQGTYNYSTSVPIGAQLGAWGNSYTNAAGIKFHRWRGVTNAFANAYIGQAHVSGGWGLDFRVENQTSASNPTLSRMFIKPNGNVGIGTTNPTQKLDVKGHAIFNTASNYTEVQFGSDRNDRIISDNSPNKYYGGGMFFRVTPDASLGIPHNYIDVIMLTDKGKVGIGTKTMGNHRLAVEGSIGAREIKVEASGWSDFVFENDYNLPTLLDVENHIKEKGHLKDIPSAEEVEKNGFFLGEMDAKLLQKIEELTLYTIEQEKKIKDLEKQNSKIKNQQKEIEELKKQNSRIKDLEILVQKLLKDKN